MTVADPPKFEKTNHHYVPRFWIKRFSGPNGELWKRQGGQVVRTSAANVMSEDWLYTDFDRFWRPGDGVEDRLSAFESVGGQLFDDLHRTSAAPTLDGWATLCFWFAVAACRHPIAMKRGFERGKELGWAFADAPAFATESEFRDNMRATFGVEPTEAQYVALKEKGDERLLVEAEEVEGLSPQDPRLPMLFSLSAAPLVAQTIVAMDLMLLEAPAAKIFVLGDTPVTMTGLGAGFVAPMSSRLAFAALPRGFAGKSHMTRVVIDPSIVEKINDDQFKRAMKVVVGADQAVLAAL